jgi:hypothetical protein
MHLVNISTLQPGIYPKNLGETTPLDVTSLSSTEIVFGVIRFRSCPYWLTDELLVAFDIRVAFKSSPEPTILVCTSQRTQRASILRTNQ